MDSRNRPARSVSLNRFPRPLHGLLAVATLLVAAIPGARAASADQVVWENQSLANGANLTNATVLTDSVGRVTVNFGRATTGLTATTTFDAGQTGNHTGFGRLAFDAPNNNNANRLTVTLTFTAPVTNLQFSLLDVDRGAGNSFVDAVEVFYNGTTLNARTGGFGTVGGANVAVDDETYMTGWEGQGAAAVTDTSANINFNFGATAISSVTIVFFSSDDAQANPVAQFIGISDLAFVIPSAQLTLRKQWSGAIVGNAITATTTGATNNATITSTAAAANTLTTGTATTVFPPEAITLPAETFTTGVQGSYATSLACTGNATAITGGGSAPGVLTVNAADTAIVCTYTNTRLNADVAVTKSLAAPNPAVPGQSLTWTLGVTNNGPGVANGVTLSDTVPAAVTGLSLGGANAGACSIAAQVVSCAFGDLANAATRAVTITGTLSATATGTLANTATIASTSTDPTAGNNSALSSTPIQPHANLAISKASTPAGPLVAGQSVTYTVIATNNGPAAANGALVTDPGGLPGLNCVIAATCSATGGAQCPGGAVNGSNVSVPIASLQSGIAIPTLPNAGSVTIVLACTVTATGQ